MNIEYHFVPTKDAATPFDNYPAAVAIAALFPPIEEAKAVATCVPGVFVIEALRGGLAYVSFPALSGCAACGKSGCRLLRADAPGEYHCVHCAVSHETTPAVVGTCASCGLTFTPLYASGALGNYPGEFACGTCLGII